VSGDTQVGRNTSSTASTISTKKKSSVVSIDTPKRKSRTKKSLQKSKTKSLPFIQYESLFPLCDNHTGKKKHKTGYNRGRLCSKDIVLTDKPIGEGQIGKVYIGYYHGLPVACKAKRRKVCLENYESQVLRELTFAAKLSACKYMNRYVGWFNCPDSTEDEDESAKRSICIIQRYIPNGDSRKYLYQRGKRGISDKMGPFFFFIHTRICY
jgi:hypothetical protein